MPPSFHLLYWLLIGACLYSGAVGYPIWTVVVLGTAALILFFMLNPAALSTGWRARGVAYLAFMVAGNSVLVAVPFFVGRLIGSTFN